MAVEVKMPQLGESVFEGTIGKWLKQPGQAVEKYEPLLEVITDKVDTEITAVESGTLLRILVPEGETVKVGTVLALVGAAGEDVGAAAVSTPAAPAAPTATGTPAAMPPAPVPSPTPVPAAPQAAATGAAAGPAPVAARVSPVAARVAAEHGVDLAQVPGTGRGGQITREDVERFVASRAAGAAPAVAATPTPPTLAPAAADGRRELGFISPRVGRLAGEHGVDLRQVAGTGRDGRITARDVERFVEARAALPQPAAATAAAAAVSAGPAIAPMPAAPASAAGPAFGELVALTPMRKAIAEHMVHSKHTAPHVTTVHEVDMGAVMQAYEALKGDFAAAGVRLTLTAILMEALAATIRGFPLVNSSWTDAGVQIHRDVNIGMAVALPGGGLIVPVIKNADEKNLTGMAKAVNDLSGRARAKGLKPDDVQGGTFTVTNYGTLGSLFGTPVINQPQTAILGTGAIKKRVVVVEGPGGDSIAIRPMMYLALTFDHRVLDGGTADPFMQALVRRLEGYGTG